MITTMCHCGKPLHYSNRAAQHLVEEMVECLGENTLVTTHDGSVYAVPRHYIALHGLKGSELPTLGFHKVNADPS